MDLSIIGASGACGREIVIQVIRDRLLERREILQLVSSNPASRHPYVLHGFRADLEDVHAEIIPELDVTAGPEDIVGDVVIVAGGVTVPTDPAKIANVSRDDLALANKKVFDRFAKAIADTRKDHPPVVIVVTNPVELGVAIFSKYLPREYVIGMGAYSDSLRFRREIAGDLGIRRQRVHGYVLGEHGFGMVPLWSSVKVQGMTEEEWAAAMKRLRRGIGTSEIPEKLMEERGKVVAILKEDPVNGAGEALRYVASLPPDIRVILKPFAIHFTDSKTIEATANATVDLIKAIVRGRPIEIAAQYQHYGESGINGPFGARLIVAGTVERVLPVEGYWQEEFELIRKSAADICTKIEEWTSDGGE